MAVEEIDEEARREVEHAAAGGRPDGTPHRQDVALDEGARIALAREVLAERDAVVVAGEQCAGAAVEAQDVGDHAQERGVEEVPPLREQRVDRGAVVLEPGALAAQREAHVRPLPGRAHRLEQVDEVRVGPVVEDDEAGVDGVAAPVPLDIHGGGVTADIVVGLEDREVVVTVQVPGRGHAGDARAHDGDAAHAFSLHQGGAGGVRPGDASAGRPGQPPRGVMRRGEWSRIATGTGFRSQMMPSQDMTFST